jgi:hypothetical protein
MSNFIEIRSAIFDVGRRTEKYGVDNILGYLSHFLCYPAKEFEMDEREKKDEERNW